MSDITLSKAVRTNLLSLQNTANMMSRTQERLATGNKVNSALDNPTNFFTASGLNARAGDLNQLLDGMANGIETLRVADNGLKSITTTLESMQSTLRQARQDRTFETQSLNLDAATLGTSAVRNLTFSGGALSEANSVSLHNSVTSGNNGFVGYGDTAGVAGSFTIQAASLNNNAAVTVNFVASDTASSVAEKINTALNGATGGNGGVTASVVNGQLSISSSKGEAITLADGSNGEYIGLVAGSESATTASRTAAGGTDLTADPDLSAHTGKTITLTAGGSTVSYTFTSEATGQKAALEAALGTAGFTVAGVAAGLDISRTDGQNFTATATDASGANDTALGTALGLGGATFTSTDGIIASGTVTAVSSANVVKTVDQLVSQINADTDLRGKVRASNDSGRLRIENQSTQELNLGGVSSSGTIDGTSTGASKIDGNSRRSDLAADFRALRDQLDKTVDDANIFGVNLLRGDNLQITFNETGTSEINIRARNADGISAVTLGIATNLQAADLDDDANIDSLIADVKNAINTVRSQASAFGSSLSIVQNRQDFTKNMINTLQTGAANLTLADMNQEAANLLALQTRQSLSSSSLSLASQADQSVLQLLR